MNFFVKIFGFFSIFLAVNLSAMQEPNTAEQLAREIPHDEVQSLIDQLQVLQDHPEKINELDDDGRKNFVIHALPWLSWLKSEWKIYRYPALVAIIGYALKYSSVSLWNYDAEIR